MDRSYRLITHGILAGTSIFLSTQYYRLNGKDLLTLTAFGLLGIHSITGVLKYSNNNDNFNSIYGTSMYLRDTLGIACIIGKVALLNGHNKFAYIYPIVATIPLICCYVVVRNFTPDVEGIPMMGLNMCLLGFFSVKSGNWWGLIAMITYIFAYYGFAQDEHHINEGATTFILTFFTWFSYKACGGIDFLIDLFKSNEIK